MSREMVPHPALNMHRIYSTCQTFTATGRVALHEPNIQVTFQAAFFFFKSKQDLKVLWMCFQMKFKWKWNWFQNIPKEFEIDVTPELLEKALGKDERENLSNASIFMTSFASLVSDNCLTDNNYSVSLRRAFVPASGCLIIGADYSQVSTCIWAILFAQILLLVNQKNLDDSEYKKAVSGFLSSYEEL